MNKNMSLLSSQMEREYEWMKWTTEIPPIHFDSKWEVKIIPPFAGAVVRFWINYLDCKVSVYLDCYDNLGYFGAPHWEIYPGPGGENERYAMNDVDELSAAIKLSLKKSL